MKAKSPRVLVLTVAEVDDMLASLADARTVQNLTGQQRQQLKEAFDGLSLVRQTAIGGKINMPVESLLGVLRCASMTQRWLQMMFSEMSVVRTNE